jgi:hypothetical protein
MKSQKGVQPLPKRPAAVAPEETAPRPPNPFRQHAYVAVILLFLVVIVWSNSFDGGFAMDSKALVSDARVHEWNDANLDQIVNRAYWNDPVNAGLYRPFTTISILFNYAILGGGEHPAGYHVLNLLIHWLNAFLVYLLALKLVRKRWPAVLIAAVWAVHPIVTESVTNIAGRADLLATFAMLSGLLLYLQSADSTGLDRIVWLAGVALVTAIGVFSKESAIMIVGLIAFYELTWWKERGQWKAALYGFVAAGIPILAMLYLRSAVMTAEGPIVIFFTDNPLTHASILQSRFTAITVIAKSLGLFVWPLHLSNDYSYNQIPLASGSLRDIIAVIVVLVVFAAAALMFKKNRVAFFFAGFAFVAFLPTSNLLFVIGTPMAERFLYAPAVGFAACLVLAAYWAGDRMHSPRFAPGLLCVIVALFGVRTWMRNLDWHDDMTLWTSAESAAPESFKVHNALVSLIEGAGPNQANLDRAIQEDEKSVAILEPLPNDLSSPLAYWQGGQVYLAKGDLLAHRGADGQPVPTPESQAAYQRALTLLLRGVQIDEALNASYRKTALERGEPESQIGSIGSPQVYYGLSLVELRLGKYAESYEAASYARMLSLRDVASYEVMGEALIRGGHREEAAVELFEGMMVGGTANPRLMTLLQGAYDRSVDPEGCAFLHAESGPSFNGGCPIVHQDMCAAAAHLIQNAQASTYSNFVAQIRDRALNRFRCTAEELSPHQSLPH